MIPNDQDQLIFDHDFLGPPEGPTYDDLKNATYGPEGPPCISVTKAARVLGISRTTAYEAVRDGTLRSIRIRRRIVIPVDWLVAFRNGRDWPLE